MLDDTTGRSADSATHPAEVAYLPGRTVTDGVTTGVVFEADPDGTVLVRWNDAGFTERCTAADLRAVHPDRPALAYDETLVVFLGENLAKRAGALDRFNDGHNNGRTAFVESARRVLADWDTRAREIKHNRCLYTYVVAPDGVRRADRSEFLTGDRLVTCTFFVDGPGTGYCGAHRPEVAGLTSIFYAEPEQHDSGEAVALSPFETPGRVRIAAAA